MVTVPPGGRLISFCAVFSALRSSLIAFSNSSQYHQRRCLRVRLFRAERYIGVLVASDGRGVDDVVVPW